MSFPWYEFEALHREYDDCEYRTILVDTGDARRFAFDPKTGLINSSL